MLLIIDSMKRNAQAISDIFYYMGVLSYAATPCEALSEISGLVSNMTAVATLRADGLTQGEIAEVLGIHEYRVGLMMKELISPDICRSMLEKCKSADLELKMGRGGYITLEKLICSI